MKHHTAIMPDDFIALKAAIGAANGMVSEHWHRTAAAKACKVSYSGYLKWETGDNNPAQWRLTHLRKVFKKFEVEIGGVTDG